MIQVNNIYTTYIVQWSAVMLRATTFIKKWEILFALPECYYINLINKFTTPMKKL